MIIIKTCLVFGILAEVRRHGLDHFTASIDAPSENVIEVVNNSPPFEYLYQT